MSRAEYAKRRALVDLRLAELRDALDRHEAGKRWTEFAVLAHVEAGLAALVPKGVGHASSAMEGRPGQGGKG